MACVDSLMERESHTRLGVRTEMIAYRYEMMLFVVT